MKKNRYWRNGKLKTQRIKGVSRHARVRHLEFIARMPYVNYFVWSARHGVTYDLTR